WYPLDKIGADPIEEGVGYNGKRPLYYCVGYSNAIKLEYRHAFHADSNGNNGSMNGSCPTGYSTRTGDGSGEGDDFVACVPNSDPNNLVISENNTWNHNFENNQGNGRYRGEVTSENDGWYKYDGSLTTYGGQGHTAECGGGCYYFISNKSFGSLEKASKTCALLTNGEGIMINDTQNGLIDREICTVNGTPKKITDEIYRDQLGYVITDNTSSIPAFSPVYCTKFVKVVDGDGSNFFWSDRVKENSDYRMPSFALNNGVQQATTSVFEQSSIPFASIAYPAGAGNNPFTWDGLVSENSPANQPLLYQEASQREVHLGKIYSSNPDDKQHPRYLFAKSYGAFEWQFDTDKGGSSHDYFADSGHYINNNTTIDSWIAPQVPCSGERPGDDADGNDNGGANYCYIAPVISSVKLNGEPINNNDKVDFTSSLSTLNLIFNSTIDKNQKPLRNITIDWGDGTSYNHSGNFIDRPVGSSPHFFTHRYNCLPGVDEGCQIDDILITITDNWGKSSNFKIRFKQNYDVFDDR
ncbi:MAG TPA: hypothetical protein PKN62_02015, partial [bacterium]|nr:hypothetical protein [bacterium]